MNETQLTSKAGPSQPLTSSAKNNWKLALKRAKEHEDPWKGLDFDSIPECRATRQVYDPRSRSWWRDEIVIKLQDKPFARGAMRECYRMKKLSKFSSQPDWHNASNYVAKCYMDEQPREVYEQDVQLQMDAKLWGDKYSKRNPPKKVDFFQAYMIEVERDGKLQLFCVEHFVEGNYIKYNSNSGFVSDVNRLTPQAFSHFTFEKSSHQLIVVDIQGVGDLYTDPQMHTVDMQEYGEANLGTRGMALFFSSHLCSPLCRALGLTQFNLSTKEMEVLGNNQWSLSSPSSTVVIGKGGDGEKVRENVAQAYRRLEDTLTLPELVSPAAGTPLSDSDWEGSLESPLDRPRSGSASEACDKNGKKDANGIPGQSFQRQDSDTVTKAMEGFHLQKPMKKAHRSASVLKEIEQAQNELKALEALRILGRVHHDLANYHSIGRFTNMKPDLEAAIFHLEKAAACGVPRALYLLGCIYRQLPHTQFEDISIEASPRNECLGMEYMLQAAETGVKPAMLHIAAAFESGCGLGEPPTDDPTFPGKKRSQSWAEAVKWYNEALEAAPPDLNELDESAIDEPDYKIQAKVAAMYNQGGHGIERDWQQAGDWFQQAGDGAMAAMKGKLATNYYMQAEEAWGNVEEQDEKEEEEES